jgi:hypothetical protein
VSDETLVAAPELAETPATPVADATTNDNSPGLGDQQPKAVVAPVDEFEDYEWEGKPVKLPKGVKEAILRHDDYTQKTQSLAEERKALAAAKAEQATLSEGEVSARLNLRQIDSQLEQYGKLTADQWREMKETNYEAWNEHRLNVISLQNARAEAHQAVTAAETARSTEAQTEMSKRLSETAAYAATLPGYTPELDKQIVDFALSKGFSKEDLARNMSPATYDVLRLARIGAEVLKTRATPNLPTPQIQPLETVGAKSNPSASNDPAKMDMDQYVSWRKAQTKG